ncbi:MAG TPA: cytochrome c [Anaerolineae bacterium]|nr:cytochrome c [Anaerolineae bacterium]
MSGKHIRLGLVLVAFLVSACNSHTEIPNEQEELIRHGQQLYVEYCAECHQIDGAGWSDLYPKLAGNPIVTLHDPEPIIVTVTYGQGSMMGFRDKLDSGQIAAILSYIRNSWGNSAAPVSSRQIH